MSEKSTTTPSWGYSRKDAKVFELAAGEKLPEGYFDHPAKVKGSDAEKKFREDHEKEGVDVPWDANPKK